ncbi:MAG TPA: hypothetical protein G4N95_02410 [Anaerolineae bacterium]|nr:hypothetical protein [Anaerolineae bacterium]
MEEIKITNLNNPQIADIKVKYCENFLCKMRGLMFYKSVPKSRGLLMVQKRESKMDSAIHMMFVFTNLTIIWLDKKKRVVDTILAKPWMPIYIPKKPALYTLELSEECFSSFNIGDIISFE